MKKAQLISIVLLILTLVIMALHQFIYPLPDWAVRVNGVLMLLSLPAVAYTTVKRTIKQ